MYRSPNLQEKYHLVAVGYRTEQSKGNHTTRKHSENISAVKIICERDSRKDCPALANS